MAGSWSSVTVVGLGLSENKSFGLSFPTDTQQTDSVGNASDLWGTAPIYSDINKSAFGTGIQMGGAFSGEDVIFNIDAIRIKVFYTEAASGSAPSYRRKHLSWYFG